ncbi:MAG: hypothetical protein ACXADA_06245 [Candidatus Hodarchaeales archaeon]|jgi:hypothetical protein
MDDGIFHDGRVTNDQRFFVVGILSKRNVITEKYKTKELDSATGIELEHSLNLGTVFRFDVIKELIELHIKQLPPQM